MFANASPKNVLIIGGGDGGVLREVLKHQSVETVHFVEIDQGVVEAAKAYFSDSLATSFGDPRVTLLFEDAALFLENNNVDGGAGLTFDCIICDSSDPVGPAASLFTPEFYRNMYIALKEGGTISTQGECQWQYLDLITSVLSTCKGIFPVVRYAYASMPSYPSGQIGFIICAKNKETVLNSKYILNCIDALTNNIIGYVTRTL